MIPSARSQPVSPVVAAAGCGRADPMLRPMSDPAASAASAAPTTRARQGIRFGRDKWAQTAGDNWIDRALGIPAGPAVDRPTAVAEAGMMAGLADRHSRPGADSPVERDSRFGPGNRAEQGSRPGQCSRAGQGSRPGQDSRAEPGSQIVQGNQADLEVPFAPVANVAGWVGRTRLTVVHLVVSPAIDRAAAAAVQRCVEAVRSEARSIATFSSPNLSLADGVWRRGLEDGR